MITMTLKYQGILIMFKGLVHQELMRIIEAKEDYFKYFGTDGISFELWLTIELAYQLKKIDGIEIYCTPSIKSLNDGKFDESDRGEQGINSRLDLVIERNGERCAIEIKIAHPKTLDRYSTNCATDIKKLCDIKNKSVTEKLFILLIATRLPTNQYFGGWETWINNIFREPYDGLVVTPEKLHPRNNDKDLDTSSVNTVLYIQSI